MYIKTAEHGAELPAPRGTLSEVGRDLASRPYARRGVAARTEPIRVLLVDDHNLVRAGVKLVLRAFPDISVVGEATDGVQALAMATRLHPEIVIMDLDMPTGDGLAATRMLKRELPDVRVLIVTMHTEEERLLPLLAAGARGFLSKSALEGQLVEAIRVVASGDVYVRPAVASALADAKAAPAAQRTDARARMAKLSQREQSVLTLTARGYNGPEIGHQLGITAKTVDTYKQRIEEKIGVSHRSEYVRFALEADILDDSASAVHPTPADQA
ncbi:MAG: response regulator transcription factor [Gemmatimonadaceae bacterium]|nr:response regulator transcription factor [Gemmatimonadaceae bacterium]